MLNVVVLPAPLGPRSAKIVSCATPKLTESTTMPAPLKLLDTPSTRSASLELRTASSSARTSARCMSAISISALGLVVREESERSCFFQGEPESTKTRKPKRRRP